MLVAAAVCGGLAAVAFLAPSAFLGAVAAAAVGLVALRGGAPLLAPGRPARGLGVRADAAMKLVAVVLNWNGGEDTPRALASLEGIETICVDNGSTDGSDAAVERDFPGVELIRTGANLGFAGGNNVGIRRALERGADWVLLLNNDAVAVPGHRRGARARPRRRGRTPACSRAR